MADHNNLSAAIAANDGGYRRRLETIINILCDRGISANSITPVEYDENGHMPYNNFIYKVTTSDVFNKSQQPFTDSPGNGVTAFVFRMSNPRAVGVNNSNRIENEVAALQLTREAFVENLPQYAEIIPRVYDWQPQKNPSPLDESSFGWIIMELLPGISLDKQFDSLPFVAKKHLLNEMSQIFAAIQKTTMPEGARAFGGLAIKDGAIVSGESTITVGGPWKEYCGWWTGLYAMTLSQADDSPIIRGWRDNGIRERVEDFIRNGTEKLLCEVDSSKLVLTHGDFTTNNMLYDPDIERITGLLDFDFTSLSHPIREFYSSFSTMFGNLHDPHLYKAIISGNFDGEKPEDVELEEWEIAREWHAALVARKIELPGSMSGHVAIKALEELEGMLCPPRLYYPFLIKRYATEELAQMRAVAESCLIQFLIAQKF